jgi:hypothetical protein
MTTRVLRPRLRRRIPYFVLALALLALSVGAAFYNPIVGGLAIAFTGFASVNAALRLFHPRSYATELRPDGFRVFDSLGRKVHDVRWTDVVHLTVFNGNGFTGPGTVLHVAWRCSPRCSGKGRQPWARGGTNNVGETYDGALPDPYLGIEPMLELMKGYADAAGPPTAAASPLTISTN